MIRVYVAQKRKIQDVVKLFRQGLEQLSVLWIINVDLPAGVLRSASPKRLSMVPTERTTAAVTHR